MATPTFNDTWYETATCSEDIPAYSRVTLTASGTLAKADATDRGVGYLTERAGVSGEKITYRSALAPSQIGIANAALEVGDLLYGAADGEVDDVGTPGTTVVVGIATSQATAAGQLITFVPCDAID